MLTAGKAISTVALSLLVASCANNLSRPSSDQNLLVQVCIPTGSGPDYLGISDFDGFIWDIGGPQEKGFTKNNQPIYQIYIHANKLEQLLVERAANDLPGEDSQNYFIADFPASLQANKDWSNWHHFDFVTNEHPVLYPHAGRHTPDKMNSPRYRIRFVTQDAYLALRRGPQELQVGHTAPPC